MTKKISFDVENVEMIDSNEDSNFAILSLDFFASGDNLHDMYVSEKTLFQTAHTIKNCPLVWKYDETLDDIYTHDKDEVPCGFVPETSTITSKRTQDGRTMLSVVAYVWKRYTGELLSFFKRDGGKKPVSVEMIVNKTRLLPNEKIELLDFRYLGITILGSFVTPAIPLAQATVLSFAEELKSEYMEDLEEEFPTKYLDMSTSMLVTFPYKSLEEINPALKGITPPITLAQANMIAKQADAIGTDGKTNGWAVAISSFKKTHMVKDGRWVRKTQSMSEETIEEILGLVEPEKEENMKVKEEVKVEMAEEETKVEEVEMEAKEEAKSEEVEMEAETKEEEKKEEVEMEAKEESKEEEKLVENAEEEKKFGFPKSITLEEMQSLFATDEDDDENIKYAKEEIQKGESANADILMSGMFAKIHKMSLAIEKMAEENKAYMAENEELKKFKASVEESQKTFAVEQTIRELEEKVIIPEEAKEEMLAEAEKYSYANIEEWKTLCKAKSFDFAVKNSGKSDVVVKKAGLPFGDISAKSQSDLWQ